MIDKEWIKNLAQSEHNGQGWIFHQRDNVDQLCERHRTHILSDLHSQAETMVQTYNVFEQRGVHMKMMVTKSGINLLLGAAQLSLSLVDHMIYSQLVMQQAFQLKKFNLHRYTPYFDTFGQLLWSEGSQRNLTYSLILQQALLELTEAYCRLRSK